MSSIEFESISVFRRFVLCSFLATVLILSTYPQVAWSFSVDVTTSERTLSLYSDQCQDADGSLDTGPLSNVVLWCSAHGAAIESEFTNSNIPASGDYESYSIIATMNVVYDETRGPISWGIAETEMDVTFSLVGSAGFSLGGFVDISEAGEAAAGFDFHLTGPGGEICSNADCFPMSGVLGPGEYQLHAYVGTGVGTPNSVTDIGQASMDFNLTLTPAPSGVEDGVSTVLGWFHLSDNFPNPFNPQTTIAFELPRQVGVNLRVFDLSGRLVRDLIVGESRSPGRHEVVWNGRDDAGRQVASGAYFYRLEAGSFSETKRMVLVK